MKLKKLFVGIFGVMALTACTSEEPVIAPTSPDLGESEPRYMSVTIRNVDMSGSRAEGEQTTDSEERTYEEGYSAENKVNSLRFYFFKANGDPAPVKYNGESYYDCTPEQIKPGNPSNGMPNVEQILNAVIVINTNTSEGSRNDIKQMVALINYDKLGDKLKIGTDQNKPSNLTLSQLTGVIAEEGCEKDKDSGFLMSSSSFYNTTTNSASIAVEIKDTDIKSTEELAKQHPVDVYVERAVAKVRVIANWVTDGIVKDVTIQNDESGEKYTAVPLKDKNGNVIRNGNNDDDAQIYVIFKNWSLWWTADRTYLYKKVGNWDQSLGWSWNNPTNKRSYWAENPSGTKLAKHPHNYPSRKLGKGTSTTYQDHTEYCFENAADPENNGLKKGYNPDAETSNRTLVYLSAELVTLNGKVATPVDLAEWAGYKYTKANVLSAMFQPNSEEQFYFVHTETTENLPVVDEEKGIVIESGQTTNKWIPLNLSDVELVSGRDAGMANDTQENSKRYLSYVNLKSDKKGLWNDKTYDGQTYKVVKQLYKKVEGGYKPVSIDDVNSQLESVGGCKVWDGGRTYYYHEIEHLGKTGEFGGKTFTHGVVRNHIYEVELQSVTGLGTPVLKYIGDEEKEEWEDIIPQKPTPDSYFLGARVNILSWRVVGNKVSLDW